MGVFQHCKPAFCFRVILCPRPKHQPRRQSQADHCAGPFYYGVGIDVVIPARKQEQIGGRLVAGNTWYCLRTSLASKEGRCPSGKGVKSARTLPHPFGVLEMKRRKVPTCKLSTCCPAERETASANCSQFAWNRATQESTHTF